ncbi:MAG TPA: HEPN domain-containing protein [Verrucomicrobiae bacterium]|jgi:HEPN domain-containing protein|nr:HEPN domain-containing protein [Verrucomicrobiae bacterium]
MSGPDAEVRRAEAARWLAIADQDIVAAKHCMNGSPPLPVVAAYHCQQSAEKIIKALLVSAGISFPKTHDLAALATLASPAYPGLAAAMSRLEPITTWGFAYRYPPEEELDAVPAPNEIGARLREIESLRDAAEQGISAKSR